jgi:hypothetical protein
MLERIVKTYQSYILHCWSEESVTPGDSASRYFLLEEVFGKQRRREFRTFEAMMSFLQDELHDQPREVQKMENN